MRRLSLLALAAICSVAAASAQTVPTKPSDHGMFDGGKFPPPAAGIVTHLDLSNALSSYVTQTALNTALDAYVTNTALTTTLGGYVAKGADLSDNTIGGSRVGDLITVQGNLVTLNAVSALLSSGTYYKAIQGGCLTPAGTVTTGGSCINSNYFVNAYYPQSGSFGSYVFAFTNASEFQGSFALTVDAAKYTMPVYAPSATFSSMAGTGNAYACVNASGQVYRSSTACN